MGGGGWIKDWRKELHSPVWAVPPIYHRVWTWLKYSVNATESQIPQRDGTTLTVERGSRITSIRQIADGVSWFEHGIKKTPNPKTVNEILNWLEKNEMIVVTSKVKHTHIRICNWDEYQREPRSELREVAATTEAQEAEAKETVPYQGIVDEYHSILPTLPRVVKVTSKRKTHMNARWKELGSIGAFADYFTMVSKSPFLLGEKETWKADFDWLMNENNAVKVFEGKYNSKRTETLSAANYNFEF